MEMPPEHMGTIIQQTPVGVTTTAWRYPPSNACGYDPQGVDKRGRRLLRIASFTDIQNLSFFSLPENLTKAFQ